MQENKPAGAPALQFPFPALVCDIGGTNVRVARKSAVDSPLSAPVFLKTHDYRGLAETILAAGEIARGARSLIACGAGPVTGRQLRLTNAPWLIDGPEVANTLQLEQGLLLNDFEAQALSLPAIPAQWKLEIKPGEAGPGPRVILGPGTGLGIGALIEIGGRHAALASEACHIGYGPDGAEQEALWPHLERVLGRVTSESVMSGAGFGRLHRARLLALGEAAPFVDSAVVGERAVADPSGPEALSVRLFWQVVARFAGDMAMTFLATGGVVLAGGILPRFTGLLDRDAFAAAFNDKAPVDALARRIPVHLLTATEAVLPGMAAIAAEPQRYALDYGARAWRTG